MDAMTTTTTLSLDERSRLANAFMDAHEEHDELIAVSCRIADDGRPFLRAQVLTAVDLPDTFDDREHGTLSVEVAVVGDVQVAV